MRSTLICFVALILTMCILTTQTSPTNKNIRVLQSLEAILQGDVAGSIQATNAGTQTALSSVLSAASLIQSAASSTPQYVASATNVSLAINATQQTLVIQNSNLTVLLVYYNLVQQMQQAMAFALQTQISMDTLVTQAAAAYAAQAYAGSASGSASALTAATALTQQLNNAFLQQAALVAVVDANITVLVLANLKFSSQFQTRPDLLMTCELLSNQEMVFDSLSFKFSKTAQAVIQKAYDDSFAASQPNPSATASSTALTSISAALTAISALAAQLDGQMVQFQKQSDLYTFYYDQFYGNYTAGQQVVKNSINAQTTAFANLNTQSSQLNATLYSSQNTLVAAQALVSSAYTLVQDTQYTSYYYYQQAQFKCGRANKTVQAQLNAQVIACKATNNKATDQVKNTSTAACNSANYKVTQANQAQVFLCANLSSLASVSNAVNVTIASLALSQSSIQAAVLTSAAAIQSISYTPVQTAQQQCNSVSTTQLTNSANQLLASTFALSTAFCVQASTSSMASIYDSLFGQAQAAQIAQNAASTPVSWQAATVLVQKLQQAYISQAQQAGALAANASRIAAAALTAASGATPSVVTLSTIATAQSYIYNNQNSLFTSASLATMQAAYSNSLLANDTPSSQTAINSVNAALTVVQLFAFTADQNLANANIALALAITTNTQQAQSYKSQQYSVNYYAGAAQGAGYAAIQAIQAISASVNNISSIAQVPIIPAAASTSAINSAQALIDAQSKVSQKYCAASSDTYTKAQQAKVDSCTAVAKTPKDKHIKMVKCEAAILQMSLTKDAMDLACIY